MLDIKFEEGLPYDTLAGLIPEQGEKTSWQGYELVCEEITPTSIVKVKLIAVDEGL